jgi:AcrR family transcriptional regulator
MSPRPRRVQDDAILDAAERVMAALGPVRFTLDEVARELGVTPQALLHRFGSKRALLLAVSARRGRRARELVAADPGASPLAALLALVEESVRAAAPSPEVLANTMAFYLADLADEATRADLLAQVGAIRANLRAFVGAALARGELAGGDAGAIADLLEVVYDGALHAWLVDRDGTAPRYVRARVEALLAPYRRPPNGALTAPA